MKDEYDFSDGTRGRFFRAPSALACAILELTVWWASQRPRPTYEATLHRAGVLAWRWLWWVNDDQLGELDKAAAELCGVKS